MPSYVPSAPANTPAEYYFVIVTPEDAAAKQRAAGPLLHPQVPNQATSMFPLHKDVDLHLLQHIRIGYSLAPVYETIRNPECLIERCNGLVSYTSGDGCAAEHAAQQRADRGPDTRAAHWQRQLWQGVQGPVARPAGGSQGESCVLPTMQPGEAVRHLACLYDHNCTTSLICLTYAKPHLRHTKKRI